MHKFNFIFLLVGLLVSTPLIAQNESDIPPPPMPEYMKKHQVKMETEDTADFANSDQNDELNDSAPSQNSQQRNTASQPAESFNNQSADSIREEFLQAGDDNEEVTPMQEVQPVQQGSITEEPEKEVVEQTPEIYEDPVEKPQVEEVSEVEVAEPEFEQANISPSQDEKFKQDYQTDVGNQPQPVAPIESQQEALADVEESLEEAGQQAQQTLVSGRLPSSKKFKSGMYKFSKECTMYSEPRTFSREAGSIPAGRKLWIDPHDQDWLKAYKKSGTVYIPADCLK